MKKTIRSILSIAIVLCMLSTSLFTGTFALSDSANNLREQIVSAINGLTVNADTTADDIIGAVTSVDASATTTWKVDFTKVLPTNGAIITLNGEDVEGGLVRGHAGSIKGILNVTSAGSNFDVAVDFTLEPTYETIDCKESISIKMTSGSTYATDSEGNTTADLVILEQTGVYAIPDGYFEQNATIKAVIVTYGLAGTGSNAFEGTTALKAVAYTGCRIFYTQAFFGSTVQYVDFGSVEGRELEFQTNAFSYAAVPGLYFDGYNTVKVGTNAFGGSFNLKQIVVDLDNVTSVALGAINTKKDRESSISTVVCKNAASATAFANAGAALQLM